MMNQLTSKLAYFSMVLIPYLALVGYTIVIYLGLPDKLNHGWPKAMIFAPAVIAFVLPLTYAAMVFFFSQYMKRFHYLAAAAVMDSGIFGLMVAVYLVSIS